MRYLSMILCYFIFFPTPNAQNIAINNSGNTADESALLDVQSTDKGVLIPRMSQTQREAINNPANGLLVFDLNSQGFWFYDNAQWVELTRLSQLSDLDNDTDIEVEATPDEDAIRMRIQGDPGLVLQQSSNGVHRFDTYEYSRNLFFGHNAGMNSSSGFNTFLGYETGMENIGGAQNVFIGYQAGMNNEEGDGTIAIGYRAGQQNTGSFNIFMGRHAGLINGDATGNTFIGYNSGDSNTSGSNNVFLGYNTAISNVDGASNTFVGQGSGFYNASGSDNTFVGMGSGRRNRTGERNVAVGNNALGTTSTSGDHGDGNTALGYRAGFTLNTSSHNSYLGEYAGYYNEIGDGNTVLGSEAGYFMTNGNCNTVLGFRAYRHNNGGMKNIAIGDSSMLNTTGSYNISIGDMAGLQSEGSHNIFIGRDAGAENDNSNENVFIGSRSGSLNSGGEFNTFIGSETGRNNTTANGNSFMGFHAGDRTTVGAENTFIGNLAGHGNTTGEQNVSLGHHSLYGNRFGSRNVALGFEALANTADVNNEITRTENTALGYRAGFIDMGNYNITLGSHSEAGDGAYNISLGVEASTAGGVITPPGSYGIAIGYQSNAGGANSISIGKSTTANDGNIILGNNGSSGFGVYNSVGIGDNVSLTQQNSIVLGDENNSFNNVGIGTSSPNAKLEIYNTDTYGLLLSAVQSGETALQVWDNRGMSIGDNFIPPTRGLRVWGSTFLGANLDVSNSTTIGNLLYVNTNIMPEDYQVAIDGKVACTEIRVQAVEDWPDYVFETDYPLMHINDFRDFIATHKHLPGVPAAKEVHESGFELGKTQEILLEKIEELSLYILQLEERLSDLEKTQK